PQPSSTRWPPCTRAARRMQRLPLFQPAEDGSFGLESPRIPCRRDEEDVRADDDRHYLDGR
ncbi:MAG: hypothetical protein ACREQ5_29930, partial [Candidatus Dormibacteria bacterium]